MRCVCVALMNRVLFELLFFFTVERYNIVVPKRSPLLSLQYFIAITIWSTAIWGGKKVVFVKTKSPLFSEVVCFT